MTTTSRMMPSNLDVPAGWFPQRVCLIAAPLLLAAGTAVLPSAANERHGEDRDKTLHVIADTAASRSSLPIAMVLVCLGLALSVPAAIGLARLVPGRRSAIVGAAMVCIGAPMGAVANATSLVLLFRATASTVPAESAADVLTTSGGAMFVIPFLLYLLVLIGTITIAAATWRAKVLPPWHALLIGGGVLIGFAAPEGPIGAVATLPFLIGTSLVAVRFRTPIHS